LTVVTIDVIVSGTLGKVGVVRKLLEGKSYSSVVLVELGLFRNRTVVFTVLHLW